MIVPTVLVFAALASSLLLFTEATQRVIRLERRRQLPSGQRSDPTGQLWRRTAGRKRAVLGVVVSAAAPAAFLKNTGTLPQSINRAVKIAFATALLSQQPGTQAPARNAQTLDLFPYGNI